MWCVERVNISHVTAQHVQHTNRIILYLMIKTILTLFSLLRKKYDHKNSISTSTKIKHINDTVLMLGKVKKRICTTQYCNMLAAIHMYIHVLQ